MSRSYSERLLWQPPVYLDRRDGNYRRVAGVKLTLHTSKALEAVRKCVPKLPFENSSGSEWLESKLWTQVQPVADARSNWVVTNWVAHLAHSIGQFEYATALVRGG